MGTCSGKPTLTQPTNTVGKSSIRRVNAPPKNPVVVCRSLDTCVRYHTHEISADYDIDTKEVIGSGYSGPVVMARSKSCGHSGKEYAVKTFDLKTQSSKKLNFLKSEVNIYLKLDHPQITRLYEVYENDDALYLVMEFCSGGELYHRLAKKKVFSEKVAVDATYQMLLALSYLHHNNIVHRDLKLENWLYEDDTENAKLKLIDFGFSKVFDNNTRMHQSCGSAAYVAPEVLRRSYEGGHCDMWSLGVIVFMLISGYPPFYGRTEEKMISLIENGRYTMRSDRWDQVSPQAKDFVRRLLELDQYKRMTAEQALQHPWIVERTNIAKRYTFSSDMIHSLREFSLGSHLKRAVLSTIAYTLDSGEISGLRELFISMDRRRSGRLSLVDFKDALENYSRDQISSEEIRRVFHCLDHENHGSIEYSQFVAGLLQCKVGLKDGLVRDAFDKFDRDHTGFLTLKNLQDVLGEKFSNKKVGELIGENSNRSEIIYYDEFVSHLKSEISIASTRASTTKLGTSKISRLSSVKSAASTSSNASRLSNFSCLSEQECFGDDLENTHNFGEEIECEILAFPFA